MTPHAKPSREANHSKRLTPKPAHEKAKPGPSRKLSPLRRNDAVGKQNTSLPRNLKQKKTCRAELFPSRTVADAPQRKRRLPESQLTEPNTDNDSNEEDDGKRLKLSSRTLEDICDDITKTNNRNTMLLAELILAVSHSEKTALSKQFSR